MFVFHQTVIDSWTNFKWDMNKMRLKPKLLFFVISFSFNNPQLKILEMN